MADTALRQSLADIYRPQRLDQVVGQEHVTRTIARLLENESVPQTILLEGGPGRGKTTLGRILARSLNCTASDGPTATPCGECDGCTMLDGQDGHPDCIELNCGEHSGIDDIRALIESAKSRPMSARTKVFILDEFQLLSQQARVILTKPLETPPPSTLFILTTTDLKAVPAAIRSRSTHFKLLPIERPEIEGRLKLVADDMGLAIGADAVSEIAKSSNGSLRDALIHLGQFSGLQDEVSKDLVLKSLPAVGEPALLAIVSALVDSNPIALLKALDAVDETRRNHDDLVPALAQMLRDLYLMSAMQFVDAQKLVRCSSEAAQTLALLAGKHPPHTVHSWFDLLASPTVRSNSFVRSQHCLEMTLLGLVYKGNYNATAGAQATESATPTIKAEPRAINIPDELEEDTAKDTQAEEAPPLSDDDWALVANHLPTAAARSAYRSTKVMAFADGVLSLRLKSKIYRKNQAAVAAAAVDAIASVSSVEWVD